jgi:AbrB family looped-hinge helix DNA binding protein
LGAVSRLSTKGQIVIPEKVRKEGNLKPGDEFLVTAVDNAILLTKIDREELRRRLDRILEENAVPGFGREEVLEETGKVRHGGGEED